MRKIVNMILIAFVSFPALVHAASKPSFLRQAERSMGENLSEYLEGDGFQRVCRDGAGWLANCPRPGDYLKDPQYLECLATCRSASDRCIESGVLNRIQCIETYLWPCEEGCEATHNPNYLPQQ
jgi:hypothetical protein